MTRIAVIGGGTMGATFIRAVTDAELIRPQALNVCELLPGRRDWLQQEFPTINISDDEFESIDGADAIYLASSRRISADCRPKAPAVS